MRIHGWSLSLFRHAPDDHGAVIRSLEAKVARLQDEADSGKNYQRMWEGAAKDLAFTRDKLSKLEKRNK